MKLLMTAFTLLAMVGIAPASAYAATYQYISVSGDVMTITAADATTAITVAPNIAPTSGVMLITESSDALPANMDVPIDPTPP